MCHRRKLWFWVGKQCAADAHVVMSQQLEGVQWLGLRDLEECTLTQWTPEGH